MTLLKTNRSIAEKSLMIVAALNLFMEFRNFRIDLKRKGIVWTSKQSLPQKLTEMLRQFLFLFCQFYSLNWLSQKGFRKSSFIVASAVSYGLSELFQVNVALLLSSFVLTRIGYTFLDDAVKRGLIKNHKVMHKVIFITFMSFFNILIYFNKSLMPRRISKNYIQAEQI